MTAANRIARVCGRGLAALAAAGAAGCACAGAAAAVGPAPLPASEYALHEECSRPAAGDAACMSVKLVPLSARARAHTTPIGAPRAPVRALERGAATPPQEGAYGLRPADLHSAYRLPSTVASAQTIAVVDAYNDPSAEADLRSYDETFGLPACTAAGGCFRQVNESGASTPLPFPQTNAELVAARKGTTAQREEAAEATGWDLEISLDLETARAICESCHILLVEGENSSLANLEAAERSAETLGAGEISNSWGTPELGQTPEAEAASAFDHAGTVITAAAGDDGYLSWKATEPAERDYAEYPASSPHVVSVGGTQLELTEAGAWAAETVWNGNGAGGGGCSVVFGAPAWQLSLVDWSAVGCGSGRSVADISAVADPFSGLAVHDTSPECETIWESGGVKHVEHWCTVGGTSLSSPLIAGVFALAGGANGVAYPARTLYENATRLPSSLHDVVSGSNGECAKAVDPETGRAGCSAYEEAAKSCSSELRCLARAGYDGPTGLGTPAGLAAFELGEEPGTPPSQEGGGKPIEEAPKQPPPAGKEESIASPLPAPTGTGTQRSGSSPGPTSSTAASAPLRVSKLRLTPRALSAIRRLGPSTRTLAFTFTASAAGLARVSVWRQVKRHGRTTWVRVYGPAAVTTRAGTDGRMIWPRSRLSRGVYRLALAPPAGAPATLVFTIR